MVRPVRRRHASVVGATFLAVLILVAAVARGSAPAHGAASGVRLVRFHLPDPSGTFIPGVYGDTIAWGIGRVDRRGALTALMVYTGSLRTSHYRVAAVIVPHPILYLNDVRISARWLSWVEYGARGEWRVMALDRRGGRPVVVDSSDQEGGTAVQALLLPLTALDGDTLAWSLSVIPPRGRRLPWSGIKVRVLPHGTTHLVARAAYQDCSLTVPSVSGRLVAWEEDGVCAKGRNDVLVADWTTGRIRARTTDHRSSEPATNGRVVAYKGASLRLQDGTIVVQDLRTGRKRVVDDSGAASTVTVTDRLVAWLGFNDDIEAFDLRTNQHYDVFPNANPLLGQGWNDEVIFEQTLLNLPPTSDGHFKADLIVAHVP